MKYAIQVSLYMWDDENKTEYEQWHYIAIKGKHKIFIFEEDVTENTKLFDTAAEAGAYVDKHFGANAMRLQYSEVRIVEVKES